MQATSKKAFFAFDVEDWKSRESEPFERLASPLSELPDKHFACNLQRETSESLLMPFERTDNFRRRVCGHERKSVEIKNATTNLAEREPGVTTRPVRTAIVIRHVWLRPISLCLFRPTSS